MLYRTIVMTRLTPWWRWHVDDGVITMKRWSIAPSISRIAPSCYRLFCTCAVSKRQMWIFIKHTNVKKGMFYHSFIPETLIFLAVMNAVTHSRKMERRNFIRAHYKVLLLPWFCSSCTHLKTKQTYWLKCIIKSTMHLIQACRVFD